MNGADSSPHGADAHEWEGMTKDEIASDLVRKMFCRQEVVAAWIDEVQKTTAEKK